MDDDITIHVETIAETLHAPVHEQGVTVTIREERMAFAAPVAVEVVAPIQEEDLHLRLAEEHLDITSPPIPPGTRWPFGANPIRVDGVIQNTTVTVDQVTMPGRYRAIKWLFMILDEANDLAISGEINAMRKGSAVRFVEFALLGDTGLIHYDLDAEEDGDSVRLNITSRHDGVLTIRLMRIGLFN